MSLIVRFCAALTAAALLPLLATAAHAHDIHIHDAYAIAALPTSVSGAAFMTIHNHGEQADRLIGARSDAAERVELHTSVEDANGVMSMVPVEGGVDLPMYGDIVLDRGGYHLMFMGLTAPFTQGRILTVTLEFEHAGDVVIEVPVDLERMTGDTMNHDAIDHFGMDHDSTDHEHADHDAAEGEEPASE